MNSLAIMVQKGFVDLEDRLGARIDGAEQKLGARIDGLEVRMGGMETRLDDIVFQLSKIEKEIEQIIKKLDEKNDRVDFLKLEKRVEILEKVILNQRRN